MSYKTLGAIGTLIAIIVALGGSVTQVSSWEYRMDTLEQKSETYVTTLEGLRNEIKILNGNMTDLTIALKEVQIKQELGQK